VDWEDGWGGGGGAIRAIEDGLVLYTGGSQYAGLIFRTSSVSASVAKQA